MKKITIKTAHGATKNVFLMAALGLSMMAHGTELNYYKSLVDEQADATKGTTQLYSLDYAPDGSLYLLSSYQTVSAEEARSAL